MKGLIDKVITVYEMRANAMSVLMANTEKAMEQSEKERKANEQAQRVESFVKDLTMNLNNMVTKFYFLEERKNRRQEELTDRQMRAMTEFAVFVKTLTGNVSSLLKRFQESQTFEEKIDKEIKELEAHLKSKLKKFDGLLEDTVTGRRNTWKERLRQYVGKSVREHEQMQEKKGQPVLTLLDEELHRLYLPKETESKKFNNVNSSVFEKV